MKMIMRYITGIFIIIFGFKTSVQGQNIFISEDIKIRKDRLYNMVGLVENRYVMAEIQNNFFYATVFDEELDIVNDFEIKIDEKRTDVIDMFTSGDRCHVFYTTRSKDTIFLQQRAYTADFRTYEQDTIGFMKLSFFTPEIIFHQSDDLTKIAAVFRNSNTIRKIVSYDLKTKETLIDQDPIIDGGTYQDDFRSINCTNRGEIYICIEKNNIGYRKSKHTFELYRFYEQAEEPIIYSIDATSFLTFDAVFHYNDMLQKYTIAGLFSNKNFNGADGVFFISMNPDNIETEGKVYKHNFTEKFLRNYHNRNDVKRNSALDLSFQQVVLRQDGGVLVFFEEEAVYRRYTSSYITRPMGPSYPGMNMDYHLEDLFIMNFNSDGSLLWEMSIPKNQYSSNDSGVFSSFFLFQNQNHMRIIYNDEVKRNNSVSETIVLSNGYQRRKTLMNVPLSDMQIQVNNGIQTKSNEVIFPALSKGDLKLVKLVMN